MTTNDFTTAARAEADRRFGDAVISIGWKAIFMNAAEWARDHLAAQEVTDAEVEAAARALWAALWINPHEHPWDTEATEAERASCRREARAALVAARAVRRDAR